MALFHTTVLDNQIKALDTIGTASGAICTFDTDRAERLVNLEVAITATGGGGTPTTPIAIYGNDSCSIFNSSINIWNEEIETGTIDNSTGVPAIDANKKRTKDFIVVKPNTTYSVYNDTGVNLYIYSYGNDKSFIGFDNTGMVTGSTFTTGANTYYIKFRTQNNPSYNNNISINNDGSTTYHAFNGSIVDFGQTIYGGSLNVGSGVLTVTHGYANMGMLNWIYGYGVFYTNSFNCSNNPVSLCEVYPYGGAYNQLNDLECGYIFTTRFCVRDDSFSGSTTNFQNSVNNKYVVYPLATPTTIQLDSKQIQAIIGTNNIYADTGDIIDLKFVLSVGKAIS